MEAYDAFVGELNADVVSRVYEDLKGITNATYMANIVAGIVSKNTNCLLSLPQYENTFYKSHAKMCNLP